jgi:hypothetical protein
MPTPVQCGASADIRLFLGFEAAGLRARAAVATVLLFTLFSCAAHDGGRVVVWSRGGVTGVAAAAAAHWWCRR